MHHHTSPDDKIFFYMSNISRLQVVRVLVDAVEAFATLPSINDEVDLTPEDRGLCSVCGFLEIIFDPIPYVLREDG
jgi:hypothetical protein